MEWLTQVPVCVLRAHVEMLPMLEADESLSLAKAVGVGSGIKAGDWIEDQIREWERTANGGDTPRRQRAQPIQPGAMKEIGIRMRTVKRG